MKSKLLNLFDVHWLLIITITSIAVLRFGVFSWLGLITYGVLLVYNIFGIFYNYASGGRINWCFHLYIGVIFIIYFLVASFFNGNSSDWATIFQYGLILIIASFVRDEKKIEKDYSSLAKVLTIAGICMTMLSILIAVVGTTFHDFFFGLPEYELFHRLKKKICDIRVDRLVGFGDNPITTSFYCFATIVFSVYLFSITSVQKWKILASINIVISSVLIAFLARSRTYMGALVVFLGIYFFIYYRVLNKRDSQKQRNFKILLILVCCCILLFILALTLSDLFRNFIVGKVLRVQNIDTLSNREDIFVRAINAGEGHRIFGISVKWFQENIASHTHNMYLEVLTFGGIPSLMFFVLLIICDLFFSIKNLVNRQYMSKTMQLVNCLAFAYVVSYLIGGITEPGGVRTMRLASSVFYLMHGTIGVIWANISMKKLSNRKNILVSREIPYENN